MILYDWKIGLTYKDSHARSVQTPPDRNVLNRIQRANSYVENKPHFEHTTSPAVTSITHRLCSMGVSSASRRSKKVSSSFIETI